MLFQKLSKSALAFVLAVSVACPMVTQAEEANVPVISVEQTNAMEGEQVQTEQQEQVVKPQITVGAADHNPKKYKEGSTAKEPIEVTIQHDKAFTYSVQWTEDDKYLAPSNSDEKVESQTSDEPVTLALDGNESGAPVKYQITAVEEGQDESQQTSFDIVVDLPKKSAGKKVIALASPKEMITSKPKHDDKGVSVFDKIEVYLPKDAVLPDSAGIDKYNFLKIGIKLNRVDVVSNEDVPIDQEFKADNEKITIILTPKSPLKVNSKYMIVVQPGAILQLNTSVPNNDYENSRYEPIFETEVDDKAPVATFNPVDNALNIPWTIQPSVSFNEPIYTKVGGELKPITTSTDLTGLVELKLANGDPVATTAAFEESTKKITLRPTLELKPYKQYKIVIPQEKIFDKAGNKVAEVAEVAALFTTAPDSKPPTAEFNVTQGATGVDPNKNFTINFGETVYLNSTGAVLNSSNAKDAVELLDLGSSNAKVDCVYTYDPSTYTLTIDPDPVLKLNSKYALILKDKAIRDQINSPLERKEVTFTTGDTEPPSITSTQNGSTNVALDENIEIKFTEPVTFLSTDYSSFITLRNTTTNTTANINLPFTATLNGQTLTLDPTSNLLASKEYTVSVAQNLVKDNANNMNKAGSFTFKTTSTDSIKPTATFSPINNATGVALNSVITVTFSEPVTLSNSPTWPGPNPQLLFPLLENNSIAVQSTYSYDASNNRLTIRPNQPLKSYKTYNLYVRANSVKDNGGNNNNELTSQFTTINDTSAPTATIFPWNGYQSYPVESNLKVTFSKPVYLSNGAEINNSNASSIFALRDNSTGYNVSPISLSYNSSTNELTIDPTANLKNNTSYTLTVNQNSVRDLSGNYLGQAAVSTFTTATDANPPSIVFSPAYGSSSNAVTTNITLSFSEHVTIQTADYASYISLRENEMNVNIPFTGSWNSSSQQLVLDPTTDLLPNRTYYVTVSAGLVKDQTNIPNSGAVTYFSTQYDYYAPTFTTNPTSGAYGVSLTNDVFVTVSEPFTHYNGTEVTSQNAAGIVSLVDSRNKTVESTVTYTSANRTFTINPVSILRSNEEYRIVISSNKIKDLAGIANSSFTSTFRTANYGVPYVSSDVTNGQSNVAVSRSFHISFSENVFLPNGTSITNSNVGKLLTFKDGEGKNVPFSASWDANNLMITADPKGKLQPSTYYYIRIEAGAVQNVSGVKNSLFSLSFSTVNNDELPSVATSPENGEEDVPLDTEIFVEFSKPVVLANGSKLTNQNIDSLVQLKSSAGESVRYKAEWDEEDLILTLNPSSRLKKNEAYTIFLPEGVVKDQSSNPVRSYTASFYTTRDKGLINIISNPQNGEEDVPINEPIYIGFGESVTLKNSVKITNTNISSVIDVYDENMKKLNVKYEWDAKKYAVKITPVTTLKPSSTYSIVVKAGKVYNRLKKTNAGHIVTFNTSTEDTPPGVTTKPDDGADNVSIKGNIEVIFKEPVTLTNGTELSNENVAKLVKLVDEKGKTVACKFKWVASSQKIILDPKLNLKKNHNYSIYIEAGVVSDLSGNLNEEFISQFTTAKK